MTNEIEAPERIWAAECRATSSTMWWPDDAGGTGTGYTRTDLSDAKDKRIAELGLQLLTAQAERDNAFLIVDENWVTHQEIVHAAAKVEKAQARIAELTNVLNWLDRGGGLGLDKHERIRAELQNNTATRG